ncbi:hypothetical protein GVAV_000408 [Gurleya vavrai]
MYKEAYPLLKSLLNNHNYSKDVDLISLKGYVEIRLEDYKLAKETLKNALKLDKDSVEPWKYLGELYIYEENFEKSLQAYKICIRKNSYSLYVIKRIVSLVLFLKKFDEAKVYANEFFFPKNFFKQVNSILKINLYGSQYKNLIKEIEQENILMETKLNNKLKITKSIDRNNEIVNDSKEIKKNEEKTNFVSKSFLTDDNNTENTIETKCNEDLVYKNLCFDKENQITNNSSFNDNLLNPICKTELTNYVYKLILKKQYEDAFNLLQKSFVKTNIKETISFIIFIEWLELFFYILKSLKNENFCFLKARIANLVLYIFSKIKNSFYSCIFYLIEKKKFKELRNVVEIDVFDDDFYKYAINVLKIVEKKHPGFNLDDVECNCCKLDNNFCVLKELYVKK